MSALAPTLVAFALRLALGLALRAPPVWDGALYHRAAEGLARGMGYSCFMFGPQADPTVATAYYPVGFPAWLSVFYATLGVGDLSRALSGGLAGAAGVALAYALGRAISDPRGARVAAWLVALSPGAALFAAAPMTETLWGALLAASVWAVASQARPSRARVLGGGALIAAAAFVRPQALVLAPLLPLIPAGSVGRRLTRALGACLVVAVLVTPWALRNCASLDGCALISTNGAGNFAIGAVPRARGEYLTLTAADGCGGVRGEIARERCWRGVSRASIARDPARWLGLMAPKVWHTWGYEAFPAGYLRAARPDLLSEVGESRLRGALTVWWNALLALALLSLVRRLPGRPLGAVGVSMLATLGAITATHAVFFGGDRYHLALLPLVAPFAGRALSDLPRGWRRGSRGAESSDEDR